MMKTRETKKTPVGKILILMAFILCMLFCSACSPGSWLAGEWTLASAVDMEGNKLSAEEFEKEIFDLGESISMTEMQAIAQQTIHCTKLTLEKDGTGSVRYVSPITKTQEDSTWEEQDGTLRISSKGRVQFTLQCDRSSGSLTAEIKEKQKLANNLVMTFVKYTLKYEKKQ